MALAVLVYGVRRFRGPGTAPERGSTPAAPLPPSPRPPAAATDPAILSAIASRRSHVWGIVAGTVTQLLDDDLRGLRHQRFRVRLETGATVLCQFNIDLSPRISPLEVGDSVVVRGEYVWDGDGGVMRWLHHDPSGGPGGGWVRVRGKEYH